MTVEDDRSYLDVKVVAAFPRSDRERFIGFLDGKDKVIGLVADTREMDEESRTTALKALRRHYFMPTIARVHSMREEYGAVYFDVDTDCGRRQFVCKGLRDAIEDMGEGEIIVPDVDGNRYRVADWNALDPRSKRLLERVV
jgi:hypothetical protein